MNVEISGTYLNGYAKPDYKDKETGEVSSWFLIGPQSSPFFSDFIEKIDFWK